jgi:hypothetical protein
MAATLNHWQQARSLVAKVGMFLLDKITNDAGVLILIDPH